LRTRIDPMSLALRMIPFCDNVTTTLCMTEPWEPRENGFVWFLNFLLSFVFPVIPWEIFFFIPWVVYFLAKRALKDPSVQKGTMSHLVLFITFFAAFYGGIAHPLGMIQAFASLGGSDGICIVHPPPTALGALGPPFKLYYGFGGHPWCYCLAIHVISVSFVGWVFIYLILQDRKKNKGSGLRFWQAPNPAPRTLHFRMFLFMFVGGVSQAMPYFAEFGTGYFGSQLRSTGGYSKRPFSPALTENLAAWSWIVGGLFHGFLALTGGDDKATVVKVSGAAA